jgi:hypothetical protein
MKLRNKKTGEIRKAEAREDGIYIYDESGWWKYDLDILAEFWEYYVEPKEPLIKDKKIRKAVKAWAQQYDHDPIRVYINSDYITLYKDDINGYSSSAGIDLSPDVFEGMLTNDKYYTITELCGEEE